MKTEAAGKIAEADAEKAIVFLAGGSDGGKKGITDDVFMGTDGGPGKRTGLAAFKELNNVSIKNEDGSITPLKPKGLN